MTARHVDPEGVPEPSDALRALVTVEVLNKIAARVACATVNRQYQVPYIAGISVDGDVIYLSSDVPDMLSDGEHEFSSIPGVMWHEIAEQIFMLLLGLDYNDAHVLATWVEHLFVTLILRLDWEGYQAAYVPYISADEHEELQVVPPDLFMGPYLDAPSDLLESMRAAQARAAAGEGDPRAETRAAGVAFLTPSGLALFVRYPPGDDPHAGEWTIPGGHVEDGEANAEAARREAEEEVGRDPGDGIERVTQRVDGGVRFTTFVARVPDIFEAVLQADELSEWLWARLDDPPRPLHPGLAATLLPLMAVSHGIEVVKDYNPDQPRDVSGRWTSDGGDEAVSTREPSDMSVNEIAEEWGELHARLPPRGPLRERVGARMNALSDEYYSRPGVEVTLSDLAYDTITGHQRVPGGEGDYEKTSVIPGALAKADTVSQATNLLWYDQVSATRGKDTDVDKVWASNADLPDAVRNSLPDAAQTVWREVANEQLRSGRPEVSAFRIAWHAVKQGWKKNKDGEWVRRKAAGSVASRTAGLLRKLVGDDKAATVEKGIMASNFNFFLPISKVEKQDDGSRIITGYASTPTKDLDGEVITLDAVKSALPAYMEWRNIRQMHQSIAVGTAKEAHVDDRGLYLRARIVEPGCVHLIDNEVLKGFSVGGRKLAKKGDTITEIELVEISVVDRPANPDCGFCIAKRAGGAVKVVNPERIDLVRANPPYRASELPTLAGTLDLGREEVGILGRLISKLAGAPHVKGSSSRDDSYARDGFSRPAPTDPGAAGGHSVDVSVQDTERDPVDSRLNDTAKGGDMPGEGSHPYGDVEYADPGYQDDKKKRYPVDTEAHIRAAWNYIHKPKNRKPYTADQLDKIEARIIAAWKSKIDKDGPPAAEKSARASVALAALRSGRVSKSANLYTVSQMIELLGRLEALEEACEGQDGCVPWGYGQTNISVPKEFTDKFGTALVSFGDMVAELLDMILSSMRDEEAEEAAKLLKGSKSPASGVGTGGDGVEGVLRELLEKDLDPNQPRDLPGGGDPLDAVRDIARRGTRTATRGDAIARIKEIAG